MTSRERYFKTFRGEKTDRMPISLFIVEQGHFMSQVYPNTDPWDFEQQFKDLIEFNKQLGADTFVRLLGDIAKPVPHILYGGVDISHQTDNWEVTTTEYVKGASTVQHSVIRTPDGTLEQEFTTTELRRGTYMYGCTKYPVQEEKDLDIIIKYEPSMDETYVPYIQKAVKRTKDLVGDDGIVGGWVPYGPFNNCSHLIPHEELYALFLTDPEFYEKLITFSRDRFKPYTQAILDAGLDVACIGGNVPGGFLGKKSYDNYIAQYEREYVDFCQKDGCIGIYHNCGKIMALVDSYKDINVKCVEPFSPDPLGDAVIVDALKTVNGDYCVIGGVDQVNIIQGGTKQQVIDRTRELALAGKEYGHGKFIIQNADFLEYNTPVENVEAFVKTALEYGQY